MLHFGWTWVGTIAADDDYGKYGIKDFKEQVEEAGVCISFSETLPKVTTRSLTRCLVLSGFAVHSFNDLQVSSPEDIQRIVQTVVEATAKIIVVFSSDVDLSPLITELLRNNVTNRTWIATEAWVTSALMLQPGVSAQVVVEDWKLVDWPKSGAEPEFELSSIMCFIQVSSLLGGTLGFAVKRAVIPGLQRYLLDLDPYSDPLTEEFWETVCSLASST